MAIETTRQRRRSCWLAILFAVALVAAACGDDDPGAAGGESVSDRVGSAVGLTVTAVDIETGAVTVTNNGSADIDLSGHQLCNRPSYVPLPDQTLAPGESIEVALGGLSAAGGEVGLYTSNDFSSSDALISYVTWGSGGGRRSVAESGGDWSGDPIGEPGGSLTLTGDPGSAAGWSS